VERHGSEALLRYNLPAGSLPFVERKAAYANQLVDVIWNQDLSRPLFSNYWSGANGWYRVAYDPGNGSCRQGKAPFSLSSSFPEGGFIGWQSYNPTLCRLGQRLFSLSLSIDPQDTAWFKKYYQHLWFYNAFSPLSSFKKIQFYSSLVGCTDTD
jgi:hypothetical protein